MTQGGSNIRYHFPELWLKYILAFTEIGMFEELPENLTYPQTSPVLYRIAEKLLKSLVSNP